MLIAILTLILSTANAAPHVYPDKLLTPGVTDSSATVVNLCTPGYTATIRNVPDSMKRQVVVSYLAAHPDWPKCNPIGVVPCEIDHLISLELGGANAVKNLWPQPYCKLTAKNCLGAREKDVVETNLHRRICSRQITIQQAQAIIVGDWLAEYKRIKASQ